MAPASASPRVSACGDRGARLQSADTVAAGAVGAALETGAGCGPLDDPPAAALAVPLCEATRRVVGDVNISGVAEEESEGEVVALDTAVLHPLLADGDPSSALGSNTGGSLDGAEIAPRMRCWAGSGLVRAAARFAALIRQALLQVAAARAHQRVFAEGGGAATRMAVRLTG